jgi:hypothetical protein
MSARGSCKHAGQVAEMHHGQLAVSNEGCGMRLLRLGQCGLGGFTGNSHGTGTKPPQSSKRDRKERVFRRFMVCIVVPAFVSIPEGSAVAKGGGGTSRHCGHGVDERDVCEYMTDSRSSSMAQAVVEVPTCLGTVGSAGRRPGVRLEDKARLPTNSHGTSAVSAFRLCTRPMSRLQPRAFVTSSSSNV